MSLKLTLAKATASALTGGLKHLAHRPAGNLPGKVALRIDPHLIDELKGRITEGTIIVVGTNGKTSTTNLLADVLEADGRTVVCNRTGANLASGIASTLLQTSGGQWGVLESDELWLARVLPSLKPRYVVLLNLFRDQLDRCGEIDRIQMSIHEALAASPETTLIYNADDPLCAAIAYGLDNPLIAFGVDEDMDLAQNTVADAQMCQRCEGMVQYRYRQYGQLGDYYCTQCDFRRPPLDFAARSIKMEVTSLSFTVSAAKELADAWNPRGIDLYSPTSSPYLVYNLTAVAVAAHCVGCGDESIKEAVQAFNPRNGRLQSYSIDGRSVLLNLAKNPTGFNQNLKIVERDRGPKAVAFYINDKVADGHDISWIWDIDFEELMGIPNTVVFAGGIRKNDLQVRLKYAGVHAKLIDGAEEVFQHLPSEPALPSDASVYMIANYTALPAVHTALDALEKAQTSKVTDKEAPQKSGEAPMRGGDAQAPKGTDDASQEALEVALQAPAVQSDVKHQKDVPIQRAQADTTTQKPVVIAHMFPDLLNLYGDGGNVRILAERLRWRDIAVEVRRVQYGQWVNLDDVDLVFLGGGPDREQKLASEELMRMRDELKSYVEDDGPLLAICGGYQILGRTWLLGDEEVPGLSIIDMETRRPGTSADRLIDNMVLQSPLAIHPVVGYENHAGRTFTGNGVQPFGKVISSVGHGNNDTDRVDGVHYKNVIGTYSHGPLLSKNPEIADYLLHCALDRHGKRLNTQVCALRSLDDSIELAANYYMARRLGVKSVE